MSLAGRSALQILQGWGSWPDEERGRRGTSRPDEVQLPSPLAEDRHREPSNLQTYISTLSIAILTELWSDAKRADRRLARDEAWVQATVSGRLVHPAVDGIESHNEGVESDLVYVTLPHDQVRLFAGFDVIALRESPRSTPIILGVQKLKRTTNQLVLNISNVGPRYLPAPKEGKLLLLAPFVNAKTRSTELRNVQELANGNSSLLSSLLMPEFSVARVPSEPCSTPFKDIHVHQRSVPDHYNRSLSAQTGPTRPVHNPSLRSSPIGKVPQRDAYWLDNPRAEIVHAVRNLEEGAVLVQA